MESPFCGDNRFQMPFHEVLTRLTHESGILYRVFVVAEQDEREVWRESK